jgi:DNA-binding GntR family transcriptional regulator
MFSDVARGTVDCHPSTNLDETLATQQWAEADRLFHHTLLETADSPHLLRCLDDLLRFLYREHQWEFFRGSRFLIRQTLTFHEGIVERLEIGDVEGATTEMRNHILREGQILLDWLYGKERSP